MDKRTGLLKPRGDRGLIPLGGLPRRDLHAPADPVQQHIQPRQRVLHPEPAPHQLADPGQRPALIRIPPDSRPRIQHRIQLAQLSRSQLAPGAARPLGGQRRTAAGRQCPPPPVRRHPRHPEAFTYFPVAGPGLDQLRRRKPHTFPAGPLLRGQPAAIGIPHDCGMPRAARPVTRARTGLRGN
jgi:hypothetical protein